MISNKIVSVVIPAKNEGRGIVDTIKAIPGVVDEVIVVDNASTDNTARLARDAGAIVLNEQQHVNGIGYGYALMAGIYYASGDYIVTVDADGEHPVSRIEELVGYAVNNEVDFLNCARDQAASGKIQSQIRRVGIWLLSLEVRFLFGVGISDILTGMWVINRSIVPLLKVQQGGWNFSPEIKLFAFLSPHIRFAEQSILATVRASDKSKQILWRTALEHALFIAVYKLRQLRSVVFGKSLWAQLATR